MARTHRTAEPLDHAKKLPERSREHFWSTFSEGPKKCQKKFPGSFSEPFFQGPKKDRKSSKQGLGRPSGLPGPCFELFLAFFGSSEKKVRKMVPGTFFDTFLDLRKKWSKNAPGTFLAPRRGRRREEGRMGRRARLACPRLKGHDAQTQNGSGCSTSKTPLGRYGDLWSHVMDPMSAILRWGWCKWR